MNNKQINRFREIIENTSNINTCLKALNLEFDSCFLCFIGLLEDAILNYKLFIDYEYITKVSSYIERVYDKLSVKKRKEYLDLIYKIRKIYTRQIQNVGLNNRGYFKQVIKNLNELINDLKNKKEFVIKEELNREHQDSEYIITIDECDAKILDDGLSVKLLPNGNLLFKVHIADPLVLYPYESDIMKKAKLNIETIYNENDSLPLIPDDLSLNKLSLLKDRNRYSKTFCYEFDRQGNIVNFYIENTVVMINKRHSYDSMNELYQNGGSCKEEEIALGYYDEIVKYLRVMFKNVRDYEKFKIKNFIFDEQKISSFSERLVSYAMVLTGYMTAKYMKEKGFPYAYRCNKLAVLDENIKARLSKDEIIKLEKFLSKSFYSRQNVGHEKLNVDTYSHVTSPLRRFVDDLNMHALDVCYFNKPNDQDIYNLEQEIDTTCSYINKQNDEYEKTMKKLLK